MNEEEQKEKSCAIDRKSKKGISAKDIAKNPAIAKMFILVIHLQYIVENIHSKTQK